MATGFIPSEANSILDTLGGTYDFIQLHTADPGAAGTSSVAGNATRKQVTWASASGGSLASGADLDWSDAEVDTSEGYTHWSAWTLASGGSCGMTGTVTASAVDASGDAFRITSGAITFSLSVAS